MMGRQEMTMVMIIWWIFLTRIIRKHIPTKTKSTPKLLRVDPLTKFQFTAYYSHFNIKLVKLFVFIQMRTATIQNVNGEIKNYPFQMNTFTYSFLNEFYYASRIFPCLVSRSMLSSRSFVQFKKNIKLPYALERFVRKSLFGRRIAFGSTNRINEVRS